MHRTMNIKFISQVCFKVGVNAEVHVESMCKISSGALLLSLLLWGSRREFFPFCMLFYLQSRITKIQINIWPNDIVIKTQMNSWSVL